MNPNDTRYLLTAHNDALPERPRFYVRNYGCQMNERDAEKLRALLTQLGYENTARIEDADFILFNTCCVRESAEDKIYGHLSRVKSMKVANPQLFVVVCGCMAQRGEVAEIFRAKHKYINVVCGTANRHRLPEFIWESMRYGRQIIDISEGDGLPELEDVAVTTREYPHKAGVNIMYGCDNYCSFCIVPYVRGREKSRPAADILAEIRALAADGVKEIMLLGQNVNAYRGDRGEASAVTCAPNLPPSGSMMRNRSVGTSLPSPLIGFAELLRRVHDENPSLTCIRFMTSHPKDFSDNLINAMRDLPRVCKHVHLPLQSGSTQVLADMNRRYTQAQYLELCAKLQTAVPDIAITTDIIVGYPGETEEDFEATLEVVRQVRFAGAFTFIYSKRSGTPAADRTDTVPRKTANERFERLTGELYPIMQERNETFIGQTVDVMVEEINGGDAVVNSGKRRTGDGDATVHSGKGCTSDGDVAVHSGKGCTGNGDASVYSGKGRTDGNTLVHFTTVQALQPGDIIPVRITKARSFYISGEACGAQ